MTLTPTRPASPARADQVMFNSPAGQLRRVLSGKVWSAAPWLVLPRRTVLFAFLQAILALVFALVGRQDAWGATIFWWPVYLIVANAITFAALVALTRREGLAYRDLWRFVRGPGSPTGWREYLTWTVLVLLGLPVGGIGFSAASVLLYGGQVPEFVGPLPLWAALLAMAIMPVSIALVELPA